MKDFSTIWQLNLDKFKDEIRSEVPTCAEMRIILKIMAKINEGLGEDTFEKNELSIDTLFSPDPTGEIKTLFSIVYFRRFQESTCEDKFGIEYHKKLNQVMVFFHRPGCVFVLTTGFVAKELKDYCDSDFPMKIASRLLDPCTIDKNARIQFVGDIRNRILKMRNKGPIDTRDITGLLTNLTAEPKKNASIYKFDFLRCLPKSSATSSSSTNEILTTTATTTTTPQLLKYDIKSKNIKLNKKLSVCQDVQLLDHYSKIVNKEKTFKFGSTETLESSEENEEDFRKGVEMVDIDKQNLLDSELYHKLFEKIKDPDYPFNFEICHDLNEKKKYATASNYKIIYNRKSQQKWQSRPSVTDFLSFLNKFFEFNSFTEESGAQIKNTMRHFKLSYFYDNKTYYDKIIDFIECVIVYENQNYWRLNQEWFQVSSDCIVDMHIKFLEILNENNFLIPVDHSDHLPEKWKETVKIDKKGIKKNVSENAFNQKFHDEKHEDFIVGDKTLVKTIELFDILKLANAKGTTTNIYHVKIGFAQKTRDVCSQLRNSAKLMYSAIKLKSNENSILEDSYNLLSKDENKAAKKLQALNINNVDDFLKKFNVHSKLTFVYVILMERKKASLRVEKDVKYEITQNDIKDYLNSKIVGTTAAKNKKLESIFGKRKIYDFNHLADEIYDDLTKVKGYFNDTGKITSRLLYLTKVVGNSDSLSVDPKSSAYDTFLKGLIGPYRSNFSSLIAKIEIVETKKILKELDIILKIDEIEKEDGIFIQNSEDIPPNTPVQGTSSNSTSSIKKSSSTKKQAKNSPALIFVDPNQKKITTYFTSPLKDQEAASRCVKRLLFSTCENGAPPKIPRLSANPEPIGSGLAPEPIQASSSTVSEINFQNSSKEIEENSQSENPADEVKAEPNI